MSAVALRADAFTTVDDAVEQIWEAVFAGTHPDVATAIHAMWHEFAFSESEFSFLALYGLIAKAKYDQRAMRKSHGQEPRPAIGYGAPHGKKSWAKYLALTWPYRAADGSTRPLLEFTAVDLTHLSEASRGLAATYAAHADWADDAAARLADAGVERVRDLPAAVLTEINASARETFGASTS